MDFDGVLMDFDGVLMAWLSSRQNPDGPLEDRLHTRVVCRYGTVDRKLTGLTPPDPSAVTEPGCSCVRPAEGH